MTLLLLTACFFIRDDTDEPSFECTEVAIRDASGSPDPCDVSACTTCVERCGDDCMIQESYPPHYACEGEGSWSVYDFCPDWGAPSGDPRAENVEDLGCGDGSPEALVATSDGPGRIAVVHRGYMTGCCPTAVQVDVTAEARRLLVDYHLVDDFCDCVCALDVSYDLVDVETGPWTVVSVTSGAAAEVTVP